MWEVLKQCRGFRTREKVHDGFIATVRHKAVVVPNVPKEYYSVNSTCIWNKVCKARVGNSGREGQKCVAFSVLGGQTSGISKLPKKYF